MRIEGTLIRVTLMPPVTSKRDGSVYEKCEAVIVYPDEYAYADENGNRTGRIVATSIRKQGSGKMPMLFDFDGRPVAVTAAVVFLAREYNGRQYMDATIAAIAKA